MAADYGKMVRELQSFYDFAGKRVLAVGFGGGKLIDLSRTARKLIAIDLDATAIRQLADRIAAENLEERVEVLHADFCETTRRGDVVYFEFSLHEMEDPEKALRHAATLAPEILVFDHLPDSEWVFLAAEEDKVRRSTSALESLPWARRQSYRTDQRFKDYAELLEKLSSQGEMAIARVARFQRRTDIVIPMPYGLTLLLAREVIDA